MALAWLFPGQGTQRVGMGKDLYSDSAVVRQTFEEADDALGWSISELCFNGPADRLTLTANTQPAILTTSIAIFRALKQHLGDTMTGAYAAGHSLGEYSALVATGALTLAEAVRLVHLRGTAMQDAVPAGDGAMAAVLGGDRAAVDALCQEAGDAGVVAPANYNAPGQIVIAGATPAVDRARSLAKARKLKAIPLKVSAPFHCALMAPAAAAVRAALVDVTVRAPTLPVVSNVTATPTTDPAAIADLLVRQIDGAVLWQQSIEWLRDAGVSHALEIGPGTVLAGLVRKTDKSIPVLSVGDREQIEAAKAWLAEHSP